MMSNPFKEAIRGVRTKLTKAIDVSDLLLGDLLDRSVITETQDNEIKVTCFTVSIANCWRTLFLSAFVS